MKTPNSDIARISRAACFAWHQGRWIEDRAAKKQQATLVRAKQADRIAHPDFRPSSPGRTFAVPQYVVTIRGDQPLAQTLHLAEQILADPVHDLVVRIELPDQTSADDLTWIENALGSDPRVRVAPTRSALDEFRASPFHIDLRGCVDYAAGLVSQMASALGVAVQATYEVRAGQDISITRAWARYRAQRTGLEIQHFGETVSIDTLPRRRVQRTSDSGSASATARTRVLAELRRVRDIRGTWRFLKWLSQGFRWWVARGRKVRGRNRPDQTRAT